MDFVDPYAKNQQVRVCPSYNGPIRDIYGNLVRHYGYNAYDLNLSVDPANIYTLNNAPGISLSGFYTGQQPNDAWFRTN